MIHSACIDTFNAAIEAQYYIRGGYGRKEEVSILNNSTSRKSISLVALLLLSILTGLITIPTVSAVNETKSGIISGTETWTGTMNLNGDVTVAEGAKLIVNAGTTINLPPGTFIDVEGAICIGETSCGASSGSAGNQARLFGQLLRIILSQVVVIRITPTIQTTTMIPAVVQV